MLYFDANANYPMPSAVKTEWIKATDAHNINAYSNEEVGNKIKEFSEAIAKVYGNYNMIITSGASESNSTAIAQIPEGSTVTCAKTCHPSLTMALEASNLNVEWLTPNTCGYVNPELYHDWAVVQTVDSETGAIQDVNEIAKHATNIIVDDTQGFLKSRFQTRADFISISFHKIGGPIGCGVLLFKDSIKPLIHGKQLKGLRGGTINYPNIAASLMAMKLFKPNNLANYFWEQMHKHLHVCDYPDYIADPRQQAIQVNNCNSIGSVATLILAVGDSVICGLSIKSALLKKNILIGTGSACKASNQTTHLPIDERMKPGLIRISFCNNSHSDINKLVAALLECFSSGTQIKSKRGGSP